MRLNKYLADHTSLSRRAADLAIQQGRVRVNSVKANTTTPVELKDDVYLDGMKVLPANNPDRTLILVNKPVGYVCSKNGQGSPTVYDLLPSKYKQLNISGRLDKDSSGLLLLTNDGQLLDKLTHPRYQKAKQYELIINKPLSKLDWQFIHEQGVNLDDGLSKLHLERLLPSDDRHWLITMHQGRNRQIRRTFAALGYNVSKLHRIALAEYSIKGIAPGRYKEL